MRDARYPLAGLGARLIVLAAALRTRAWLPAPIAVVRRIAPRALLVIAPEADRLIHWRQGERLFRAAGEPKELYVVSGAAHADAYVTDAGAYERRVLGFLERYLG
jgi:fermentation-respiration switch protein FrsA (DUF1100 family)